MQRFLAAAGRELWVLFVEDGVLAASLVLWSWAVNVAAVLVPVGHGWQGPVLLLGYMLILVANVRRAARRHLIR